MDCLIYEGRTNHAGYGVVDVREAPGVWRERSVHRLLWEARNGPIPEGMEIDHLCHDPRTCVAPCPHRACFAPWHLGLATHAENSGAGRNRGNGYKERTHCIRNHEFTPENTGSQRGGKGRYCRECHRMRNRGEL